MSQIYARIVGGAFTQIRYTSEALRFGTTIADIVAAGDEIYPVIDELANEGTEEAPVFRAPTDLEIANAVTAISDIAKPLYQRDLGIAGGVASLDESGDLLRDQMPDEVVEYLGTWDPETNTPELANGIGNIGDTYLVSEAIGNVDYTVNLGGDDIKVRGGMSIVFRAEKGDEENGIWVATGGTGLSTADREMLENAQQNVKTYAVSCLPAAPATEVGGVILAQVSSEDNPYPEFMLVDDGGLSAVTLNAFSGELRIDTAADAEGAYDVIVKVGGALGQSEEVTVTVTVNAAA